MRRCRSPERTRREWDDGRVLLRIEGYDLPGRTCAAGRDFPGARNVHVAVQRKDKPGELLDVQPGDAASVAWDLECEAFTDAEGTLTLRGRHIQNRLGGRFVYVSWGEVDDQGAFHMFRRAKLLLSRVDPQVMAAAVESGTLLARMRMTDAKGHPAISHTQPPNLVWSAPASTLRH
jgi:hypothetical protein